MQTILEIVNEVYPLNFSMDEFKAIRSYKGKVQYAASRLRRISSGSGRIVFDIDNEKVLKLAYNEKGRAQNRVESDRFLQEYDITARTFDSDPDDYWLEMELAKKCKKGDFDRIEGLSFETVVEYCQSLRMHQNGRSRSQRLWDYISDMQEQHWFLAELTGLVENTDSDVGDYMKLSSYGIVNRDGQETIVLVDFGLSSDVFKHYYR